MHCFTETTAIAPYPEVSVTWEVGEFASGDFVPLGVVFVTKELVDLFVSQFEAALYRKQPFMMFDEDKPKFTMRLSGREDEEEEKPDLPLDVGLE